MRIRWRKRCQPPGSLAGRGTDTFSAGRRLFSGLQERLRYAQALAEKVSVPSIRLMPEVRPSAGFKRIGRSRGHPGLNRGGAFEGA
jgi:hypothetical protein